MPLTSSKSSSKSSSNLYPSYYDIRLTQPGCIGPPKNQLNCGSCWAFAVTSTIGDRHSILKRDISSNQCTEQLSLSPQWLINCNSGENQGGCEGGMLFDAQLFVYEQGVVNESCFPYAVGEDGSQEGDKNTSCPTNCENTGSISNRMYANYVNQTTNNINLMRSEIQNNGPISMGFPIYVSFFQYKSGVFDMPNSCIQEDNNDSHGVQNCSSSTCCEKIVGWHATEVVGWGTDDEGNGQWIGKNSWGCGWGEGGQFKYSWNMHQFQVWADVARPNDRAFTNKLPEEQNETCAINPDNSSNGSGVAKGNCASINEFGFCMQCKNGFNLNEDGKDCSIKGNQAEVEEVENDIGGIFGDQKLIFEDCQSEEGQLGYKCANKIFDPTRSDPTCQFLDNSVGERMNCVHFENQIETNQPDKLNCTCASCLIFALFLITLLF